MSAEQIAPLITATLSADKQEREAAQTQLDSAKAHPDYATSLLTILLQQDAPLAARQMAGVLLKQAASSWNEIPHTATKELVKANILNGLGDGISKIRASIAYVISEIAQHDFPENWPTLFDQLLALLGTGEPNFVHGVMRVLSELATDITDNQVYTVAPILFPQLVSLFRSEQFEAGTRARALSIFSVFITLIEHMDTVDPKATENLLYPVLPGLVEETVSLISKPIVQPQGYKLVTESVNFLTKLVQTFPKQMGDKVSAALPTLWQLLTANSTTYLADVVNNDDYEDEEVDSDGSGVGFSALVQAIFEFIQSLTERKKYKTMIRKVLPDVVFYLITYLSLPNTQIEKWNDDPERYVEDDDEDSMTYSVRNGAIELIVDLGSELKTAFVEALVSAISRQLATVGPLMEGNNWKVYEACATALNCSEGIVEECIKNAKVDFDFGTFYRAVVVPGLQSDKPYLAGRLLWLCSSYIRRMPDETSVALLLDAITKALQQQAAAPLSVGAMKGIYSVCVELETPEEQVVLHKAMEGIIPALFDLATTLDGDLLILCLDAVRCSVSVRPDIVAAEADKVNAFLVKLFVKHSSDTFIVSQVNEVLITLADIEACLPSLQNIVLPVLLQILKTPAPSSPKKSSEDDEEDMRTEIMDLMTVFVRKTPEPLPEVYINEVYPAVMSVTMGTTKDSTAVLQSGGECVRAFLAKGYTQLTQLNIGGISGSDYALQLIGRLLDISQSEYSAVYAGKLVTSLILHAGTALNINEILQAVLNKLCTCETPTVQQSLLVVFIKLFNHDMEGVMTFLQGITTPTGENGLAYVLKKWCEIQELFSGEYETKVGVIALTRFLPMILTGDSPLATIMVNSDEVALEGQRITRSAKTEAEPTLVPISVKIFKILVSELGSIAEEANALNMTVADSGDEEEEDDEEEVEEEYLSLADLAAMMEGDDDDDDEDNKKDPLYEVDLHSHLQGFLTQLSTHGQYPNLCQALNDNEKTILTSTQAIGS